MSDETALPEGYRDGREAAGASRYRPLFVSDSRAAAAAFDQPSLPRNLWELAGRRARRARPDDPGNGIPAARIAIADRLPSVDPSAWVAPPASAYQKPADSARLARVDEEAPADLFRPADAGGVSVALVLVASAVPNTFRDGVTPALPAADVQADDPLLATIAPDASGDGGAPPVFGAGSTAPSNVLVENEAFAASGTDPEQAGSDAETYASMSVVTDHTALLSGSYWGGIEVTGTPVIITFSFPTSFPAYSASIDGFTAATYASFLAFTAAQQAQAIQALGEWSAASGLIFIQVAPGLGDINFMNVDFNTTSYAGAGGIGFYPFGDWNFFSYPNYYGNWSPSGDVFMNSQFLSGGVTDYATLLHETGHAIGLKHPTEIVTNYAANPVVVHDEVLSSDDPTRTIMATVGGGTGHLQPLDEDAAAYIYGPAGTGGTYTGSASGTNSVANWTWDASTQTLTQTAVAIDATIRGSSVNDIIYGSSGADSLFGLSGTDVLYGQGGADALFDGAGNATLIGGAGDDSYYVSNPTTTISEAFGEGYDAIYATVSYALRPNTEALYLYGSGLTGSGNELDNVMFGDAISATTLIPGSGTDYVVGGAGDDVFKFFAYELTNLDVVIGGGGSDTLLLLSSGTINAGGVSGVETFTLSGLGPNTLTLTNANFTDVVDSRITVKGGGTGNVVDASALTGANRIVFVATSDGVDNITGGAGNDLFKFSPSSLGSSDILIGGGGTDTLLVTFPGALDTGGISGIEIFTLANGGNTLVLSNGNFLGTTSGVITLNAGAFGNTIDASGVTGTNRIMFNGGAGIDNVTGGAGADQFKHAAADLSNSDTLIGGGGNDMLIMTTAGTVNAGGVSGIETFKLSNGGANTLTLTNANFVGIAGDILTVNGGSAGNTVDASALTGPNRVVFVGGNGVDNFTGGGGNDQFRFTTARLSNADTLTGGAGTDTLVMTTTGTINAAGISGVEIFTLGSGATNTLTLTNANYAGVTNAKIRVNGGSTGNIVDASALTGGRQLVFIGGDGNDRVQAGPMTTMTGGAGSNRFTFADIGNNSITDFGASASNALVLRDAGFDLGANEGQGTAVLQHLSASAFVANATGAFTTTSQRFSYNTTNGTLRYDQDGSGSAFGAVSVVVLAGQPSLSAGAAGQLYFTS